MPAASTARARCWRHGAGAARGGRGRRPRGSWALGLLGLPRRAAAGWCWCCRILSIPSPVLLSMLFRGEVGAIGRGELRLHRASAWASVLSVVAIGGVVVSAYADVALAERFVHDPETEELRRWPAPARADAPGATLARLVGGVGPGGRAAAHHRGRRRIVVDSAVRSATSELIDPSTTQLPLVGRVCPAIAGSVALLVARGRSWSEALVEPRLATADGERLGAAARRPPGPRGTRVALGALGRVVRSPLRVVATALAGWLDLGVTSRACCSAPCSRGVPRGTCSSPGRVGSDPLALGVSAAPGGVFAAVWLGGLGLVGFASRRPFGPLDGRRATLTAQVRGTAPGGPVVLGPSRTTPTLDGWPGGGDAGRNVPRGNDACASSEVRSRCADGGWSPLSPLALAAARVRVHGQRGSIVDLLDGDGAGRPEGRDR